MFSCYTRQWMNIEKIDFVFSLYWRRQWVSTMVLCLSEEQVCALHSRFPPEYMLMFSTAPENTRVESIHCLGLDTEAFQSCEARR